jgi:hypothetical protein
MPLNQQPSVLPNFFSGQESITRNPQTQMQKFHCAAIRDPDAMHQISLGRGDLHPQHWLILAPLPTHPGACGVLSDLTQVGQVARAGSAQGLEAVLPRQVDQTNQRGQRNRQYC